MKTFKRIQKNPNLKGLEIYEIPNVWHISEDKQTFYFSSIGVCISARYYNIKDYLDKDGTTFLNESHQNKFKIEIQYDYRNPEKLHSMDYEFRGTFGVELFADTIDEGIKISEDYLNGDFEGIRERNGTKILKPSLKISRYDLAEIATIHHLAMFEDSKKEDDFTRKMFKNLPKEKSKLLNDLIEKYKRRDKALKKYDTKIKKVFKNTFGFSLQDCKTTMHEFSLGKFIQKTGSDLKIGQLKDNLKPYELKVIQKAFKRFNY